MFPHERSLVKRLEGKPFVLLGVDVNDEDKRDLVKHQLATGTVTWRSWWDEKSAIANRWGVHSLPGIFLIDAQGVLRYVGLRGRELDEAIDKLVAETENKAS